LKIQILVSVLALLVSSPLILANSDFGGMPDLKTQNISKSEIRKQLRNECNEMEVGSHWVGRPFYQKVGRIVNGKREVTVTTFTMAAGTRVFTQTGSKGNVPCYLYDCCNQIWPVEEAAPAHVEERGQVVEQTESGGSGFFDGLAAVGNGLLQLIPTATELYLATQQYGGGQYYGEQMLAVPMPYYPEVREDRGGDTIITNINENYNDNSRTVTKTKYVTKTTTTGGNQHPRGCGCTRCVPDPRRSRNSSGSPVVGPGDHVVGVQPGENRDPRGVSDGTRPNGQTFASNTRATEQAQAIQTAHTRTSAPVDLRASSSESRSVASADPRGVIDGQSGVAKTAATTDSQQFLVSGVQSRRGENRVMGGPSSEMSPVKAPPAQIAESQVLAQRTRSTESQDFLAGGVQPKQGRRDRLAVGTNSDLAPVANTSNPPTAQIADSPVQNLRARGDRKTNRVAAPDSSSTLMAQLREANRRPANVDSGFDRAPRVNRTRADRTPNFAFESTKPAGLGLSPVPRVTKKSSAGFGSIRTSASPRKGMDFSAAKPKRSFDGSFGASPRPRTYERKAGPRQEKSFRSSGGGGAPRVKAVRSGGARKGKGKGN
jgi:hypothetical protein